jgi:hypothetical protein
VLSFYLKAHSIGTTQLMRLKRDKEDLKNFKKNKEHPKKKPKEENIERKREINKIYNILRTKRV